MVQIVRIITANPVVRQVAANVAVLVATEVLKNVRAGA